MIFSAHYDHLGIGKPDATGDSIYNGANDDASGTTAVIALAKYFSKLHNNERTLIFAAFTAEEIGEFGSAYFSGKLNPDKVMAMLNIEMIGTESKWGKNSAYITGYDKSDMGAILQKNLGNTQFRFYPDPYPEQMLFLRSDNATHWPNEVFRRILFLLLKWILKNIIIHRVMKLKPWTSVI